MRRTAIAAAVLTALVGLVLALVGGSRAPRPDVQNLGVVPAGPVAILGKDKTGCQQPVGLAETVRLVDVVLGPFTAPRGPVMVTIRERTRAGRELARASVPPGPLPSGATRFTLDRPVTGDRDVAICITNGGRDGLELIGDVDSNPNIAPPKVFVERVQNRPGVNPTRTTDGLELNGQATGYDLTITFPRAEPSSALAQLPAAFRHAAAFRPFGVGAWTYWLLAGLIVPALALLLVALTRTMRDDDDDRP